MANGYAYDYTKNYFYFIITHTYIIRLMSTQLFLLAFLVVCNVCIKPLSASSVFQRNSQTLLIEAQQREGNSTGASSRSEEGLRFDSCAFCASAANKVINILKDPTFMGNVESFLDKACARISDSCQETVDYYIDLIQTAASMPHLSGEHLCDWVEFNFFAVQCHFWAQTPRRF